MTLILVTDVKTANPTVCFSVVALARNQDLAVLKEKAEAGDSAAQVTLGLAYASGDGVTFDETQAVKWFRKAADQKNPAGEYFLGEMYDTGRGVSKDPVQAQDWFRRAANHGDPRAQYNLAAMYSGGVGVTKNDAEAVKWMRKAADQGFAPGQFGLGVMYSHGQGVPKDSSEAVKWYRKAGEQGDVTALNNLAFLFATSRDVGIRNPNEAVAIALKALEIDEKNPTCLDTLAAAYYESGQYEKAVETEQKALELSPDNSSYKKMMEKYQAAVGRKL